MRPDYIVIVCRDRSQGTAECPAKFQLPTDGKVVRCHICGKPHSEDRRTTMEKQLDEVIKAAVNYGGVDDTADPQYMVSLKERLRFTIQQFLEANDKDYSL